MYLGKFEKKFIAPQVQAKGFMLVGLICEKSRPEYKNETTTFCATLFLNSVLPEKEEKEIFYERTDFRF